MKRQATDWDKVFAKQISDTGFMHSTLRKPTTQLLWFVTKQMPNDAVFDSEIPLFYHIKIIDILKENITRFITAFLLSWNPEININMYQ